MRTAVISHSSIINKNREQFRKIPGEVRIFGPSKWYDKSYRLQIEAEISEDYTPVTVLFKSKPNLHLYSPFLLRKLMEYSPDIIFVHEEAWAPACAFTAFFSGGRLPPFVFYSNEQKQEKISTARRIIQDYVFKKASGAVAVSKAAASRIKDNGFSAPVCVVPYSINQMPSKGYFPGKVLKAGYIGRFIKEKGVLDLAEALKGVDGITVKTAGDGPCAEEFKNSVENSGVPLDFMGYVPHDKTDNFYSG
ncbi:MAG: glycosyltransferase, partial [Fibrobacterota bacterium]